MGALHRYAASLVALVVFAGMALLYWDEHTRTIYFVVLRYWGIDPYVFPYLDFAGYLSSLECTRLGIDVIAGNPCDPLDRQFNYGPLWLDLIFLPVYPRDRIMGGTVLNLIFLASFSMLAPPRGAGDMAIRILAAISPAVVFAVERANPDILIFLLVAAAVALIPRGVWGKGTAYALIWFGAGLKFYPIVVMGLALRESKRWFWGLLAVSFGLIGLYALVYHVALGRILPLLPSGNYNSDLFAAKNLPMQIGLIVCATLEPGAWATPIGIVAGVSVLLGLLRRLVKQVRCLLAIRDLEAALATLPDTAALHLLAGSLLIVGCFFAGQSIAYRAIFLMFTLPGIVAMGSAVASPLERLTRRAACGILFLMWEEAIRSGVDRVVAMASLEPGTAFLVSLMFWVFRELVWWWGVGLLLAVILLFLRASAIRQLVWPDRARR